MQLSDRKALGAYYTPAPLADFLVDWAVDRPGMRILEPAVGAGSLIRALEARLNLIGGGKICGFEIDRSTFELNLGKWQSPGVDLRHADFLTSVDEMAANFDAVIANPPFTRNHALPSTLKARLKKQLHPIAPPLGAAGIWVYFVLSALKCLRPGGKIAFVLPGAAMFADYFRSVSAHLIRSFSSVELVEVLGRVEWEGEAQERAVLLLAAGFGAGTAPCLQRKQLNLQSRSILPADPPALAPILPHTLLSAIADIEIGFVTGANRHFLLDSHQVKAMGLVEEELRPAVTRCRHIVGCHVRLSDIEALGQNGERVYLLTPGDLEKRGTSLRRHLATIPRQKRKSTAWFSKRFPWWKIQIGKPADAAFTYMNHMGPRMAILEPNTAVSNTLHKVRFKSRSVSDMRTACVSLLTTYTQLHAEVIGRVYGGGVLKFEVKDARALPLLIPEEPVSEASFSRIDTSLRSGAATRARELADEAIMPFLCGAKWRALRDQMYHELTARRLARGVVTS